MWSTDRHAINGCGQRILTNAQMVINGLCHGLTDLHGRLRVHLFTLNHKE